MKYLIIFQVMFLSFSIDGIGQVSDTFSWHKLFKLPKSEQSINLSIRFPVYAFGDNFRANESSSTGGNGESIEVTNGSMGAQMGYEIGLNGNYYFDKKSSNCGRFRIIIWENKI